MLTWSQSHRASEQGGNRPGCVEPSDSDESTDPPCMEASGARVSDARTQRRRRPGPRPSPAA